jgi:hypothetical protein
MLATALVLSASALGAGPSDAALAQGRFIFNITVNIISPVPYEISWEATVNHVGETPNYYFQQKTVTASRVGNVATCVIHMAYRWAQADTNQPVTNSIGIAAMKCTSCTPDRYFVTHNLPDFALPTTPGSVKTINYVLNI